MTLPHYSFSQIDWGKCPQLKPTEADKEQKRVVIQKCLDENPPPALETVTDPKQIDDHREIVTTCALKTEGWFNSNGTYKFDRAQSEIQSKKLDAQVEKSITQRHQECQDEAVKRFPMASFNKFNCTKLAWITISLKGLKVLPNHKQSQKKPPKKDVSMFFLTSEVTSSS
ncbi:uncharacterized protein TNCT_346691 [Trichonephila clavata]|uniref:Uncharacterized protein n=1 Tax=Trichonephila clavata TaxID=2740835 RepID=A0A8X6GB07_TRICU|nr:uncharacterized protein TNCT_346691 [Trichonephila clavata]